MTPTPAAAPHRETNWRDLDFRAESISHLLHWDLAYLWCLELPEAFQPGTWRERLEAWRRLMCLLLTGQLTRNEYPLRRPLLDYTAPLGIDRVCELSFGGRVVGVTSSVVIARPLPDFQPQQLPSLPDQQLDKSAEAVYCLNLLLGAVQGLAHGPGDRSLQTSLLKVLTDLSDRWSANAAQRKRPLDQAFELETTVVPLQRAMHFGGGSGTDNCRVCISRGIRRHVWLPKCSQCQETILFENPDPPVAVKKEGAFELRCSQGHRTEFPVDRLFIWLRDQEAICWTDREDSLTSSSLSTQNDPAYAFPPSPECDGNRASFHWGPEAGPNSARSWLTLQFPVQSTRSVSLQASSQQEGAMFAEVVVAGGGLQGFQGLPVRPDWRDAWQGCGAIRANVNPNALTYEGVRIRGVPFAFNFAFAQGCLRLEQDLAVGIYPKPMYPEWKRYRAFAAGAAADKYRILTTGQSRILESIAETERWPEFVAAESRDGRAGAFWHTAALAAAASPLQAAVPPLQLGVDFGTSNSVCYYRASTDKRAVTTADHALRPGDLGKGVHWVARHPASQSMPCFLPSVITSQDPCIIPSAVWMNPGDSNSLTIRWSPDRPGDGFSVYGGFKWDEPSGAIGQQQPSHLLRREYLREVLWLALPAMFHSLGNRQRALQIAFAYPLAFKYAERQAYRRTLDELTKALKNDVSPDVQIVALNESLASVRATGAYCEDDWFLVADMGGRTLDLAMFRYGQEDGPPVLHYIGSIDFGGESFLDAVVRQRTLPADQLEDEYWRLRDAIVAGTAATGQCYQDRTVERLLRRFHPMAMEFVRVMLAAFATSLTVMPPAAQKGPKVVAEGGRLVYVEPEPPPAPVLVRVHLVGNGWNLLGLAAADLEPAVYVRDRLQRWIGQLGAPVTLADPTPGVDNSKHLVACGALKAIGGADELSQQYASKLPFGRSMTFKGGRAEWYETCGEGGIDFARPADIRFDPDGPPPPADWARTLDAALPKPSFPQEQVLRELVLHAIEGDKLRKSPLALIMENHWKGRLCDT